MIYEIFEVFCEALAKNLHTIVECSRYDDYGWASVDFMTDKFGGGYAHFHYDLKTNVITYNFGYPDSKVINDISELPSLVKARRDYMLKARDMDGLYKFINDQY